MISLEALFNALAPTQHTASLSLATLLGFIRVVTTLKPVILHRQKSKWNPANAPSALPSRVATFVACHLGLTEEQVDELWRALGSTVWAHGEGMLVEGNEDGQSAPRGSLGQLEVECLLSDRMLFPPTRVCVDPMCPGHGRLLRMWEPPSKVTMFSHAQGVYEGFSVRLTCKKCKSVYHPNYIVRDEIRQYYAGIPDFIQVSGHKYVERSVLEYFTTLSVLSWTSATNAAHIYHESLSGLTDDLADNPHLRLRTEHTWDGFVILALLRDAQDHDIVLEVPHKGEQKDRFTAAMRARNERIRREGQPEYAHWCTRCVRRFDDEDGVTRFVDCIITDGIEMGRPCCAVRHCTGELMTTQDHFCPAHANQELFCVVEGCCYAHREGHRTCPLHAGIEERHLATGQAMFTLRTRMQRAKVSHPTDAVEPAAPEDEDYEDEEDLTCSDKTTLGKDSNNRARFGRRRTHNEQLIVRPCGVITARETFYGSETVPQVVDMLRKKHPIPGSLPSYIHYDNNCTLYKHLAATPGEDLHLKVGLPVDVFHWTCKHKKSDVECSYHCNPHTFPELLQEDGKAWYFNSSRAEQTNVWFGGYHAIIREMGIVKYEFFLDEMILRKNEMTRKKLERDGCMPGYREDM